MVTEKEGIIGQKALVIEEKDYEIQEQNRLIEELKKQLGH